jgi:hypothetical protein
MNTKNKINSIDLPLLLRDLQSTANGRKFERNLRHPIIVAK